MRTLTRYRRTLIAQRSRVRNRVQKVLDRSGVRVGGVLSDVFGSYGLIEHDPAPTATA